MARWLTWLLLGLAGLVLLVAGLLAFVAGTHTGLRWAWSMGQPYLPDGIEVASVEGRLLDEVIVSGVRVDLPGLELDAVRLRLAWQPGRLWQNELRVRALEGSGITVTTRPDETPPADDSDTPTELPERIELPLRVVIERLAIRDVAYRAQPDAEPIRLDRAELGARLDNQQWQVDTLTLRAPLADADGDLRLTPVRPFALEAGLDWTVRAPDLAPVSGQTRVGGDLLERLTVDQTVAAPYNARAEVVLTQLLDAAALDATVHLNQTDVAAIRADLPPAGVDAELNASGPLGDLDVQGWITGNSEAHGRARLDLAANVSPARVRLDTLRLTSPDMAGELNADGRVALGPGTPLDVRLRWHDLQWPLAGEPTLRSDSGSIALDGRLDDYRLDADIGWQLPDQDAGQLQLAGSGDLSAIRLPTIAVSGGPGRIAGDARVAWAPALDAEIRLAGDNVNPGAIQAAWPGNLSLDLHATAAMPDGALTARVETLAVDGRLRDVPVRVDATAGYRPERVDIDRLLLEAGGNRLTANGRLGLAQTTSALDWNLDAPTLNMLAPFGTALNGAVAGEGRVSGTLQALRVNAELNANDLEAAGNELAALTLSADIDRSGQARSKIDLQITDLQAGGQTLDAVTLAGDGTPADHQLRLALTGPQLEADLGLTGALTDDETDWAFTLQQFNLTRDPLPTFALAAPAAGRLNATTQSLEQTCLTGGDARLCLSGQRRGGEITGNLSLQNAALALARPWLPPDLALAGTVDAEADARIRGGEPDVTARINTSAGAISATDADGNDLTLLGFEAGQITATLRDSRLTVDGDLPLTAGGRVALAVNAGDAANGLTGGPLSGTVDIAVPDLSVITRLTDEVEAFEGGLDGQLDLGGSLSRPELIGEVALEADRVALVTPGLELTAVRAALVGQGNRVQLDAGATSGEGTVEAGGTIGFGGDSPTVDLTVRGDRFLAMDTRDARVLVSPDLTIGMSADRIDVTGTVTVPEADITPRELPAGSAVTVSDDQVIVSADNQPGAAGRALHADVTLVLGDAVHFEGFGLTADIAGDLRVRQQPGDPPTGTGELRVTEGRYKAYGQDLDIQRGRVLFAGGPVTQPGLDVRAVRRPATDILVGVQVRGNLRTPDFTLYSEPGMGQSEQLSWLLLGRPLDGASSSEASLVSRAALALGLKGGNTLVKSVGDRLGLDEIGIDSAPGTTGEQAALMVGKWLTPRLYVNYGVGLFEPVSTLRLRYTLTPLWRIQTESTGAHSGGDLLFSIERP